MVRYLLSRGARDDMPVKDGYSPLHAAAKNGHTEVCKVLL
jgi:ankyrin repeat protein